MLSFIASNFCVNCTNINGVTGIPLMNPDHQPHEIDEAPLENLKIDTNFIINKVTGSEGRPLTVFDVQEITTYYANLPEFVPMFNKYPQLIGRMLNHQINPGWILKSIIPINQLNSYVDLIINTIHNDKLLAADTLPLVPVRVFLGYRRLIQTQITNTLKNRRRLLEWFMREYILEPYNIIMANEEAYGIKLFTPTELSANLVPKNHPFFARSYYYHLQLRDLNPDAVRDPSDFDVPNHRWPEFRTDTEQRRALPLKWAKAGSCSSSNNIVTIPSDDEVTEAPESAGADEKNEPPKKILINPLTKFSLKNIPYKRDCHGNIVVLSNSDRHPIMDSSPPENPPKGTFEEVEKVRKYLHSRINFDNPQKQSTPTNKPSIDTSSSPVNFNNNLVNKSDNSNIGNQPTPILMDLTASSTEVSTTTGDSETGIFEQTTELVDINAEDSEEDADQSSSEKFKKALD